MTYAQRKEMARNKAIEWQGTFTEGASYSWSEMADFHSYFSMLARHYGLIREFKENGVI